MNTQVVVITHAEGRAAFFRHQKFWEAFQSPILILTPDESDLSGYDYERLSVGKAQHNGPDSIIRLQALFETLEKRNWDRCIIYEYDSFSLTPKQPCGPGLFGIVFKNHESPKFMAPRYVNPPWSFDRKTFDLMHSKSTQFHNLFEDGEADRWISALAFLAGVPIFNYDPPGFSRGTITSVDIPDVSHAVREAKAIHFHGVKQEWVLRAVEQFYDEANPHNKISI